MLIINLYKFITGYVEIAAIGEFCEKILNLFSVNRIQAWGIVRQKNELHFYLSIKDFRKIRKVRGESKVKIKIIKKCGLPFKLKKYIKRIGIPVGVGLFIGILNILSLFAWNITVSGNERVPIDVILSACREIGIKEGVKISSINTGLMREKLLLKCNELSWSSFNIEGSKITVNVTEIKKSNNENAPCNIIADFDGTITEIMVESGMAQVEKGYAVRKGDILVGGVMNVGDKNQFVRAKARIFADVSENIEASGEFSQETKYPSQKQKNKYVLEILNFKIPLYLGSTTGDYFAQNSCKQFNLFNEKMPIRLYKKTFNFLNTEIINMDRSELLEKLTNEINIKIEQTGAINPIINSREITETENGLKLIYNIKYNKIIGKAENLIFDVSK